MKFNELICPTCGLKCLTDDDYITCSACSTLFYASQSKGVSVPAPSYPMPYVPFVAPQPPVDVTPKPIWVAPLPGGNHPYGPTIICEGTDQTSGSVVVYNGQQYSTD